MKHIWRTAYTIAGSLGLAVIVGIGWADTIEGLMFPIFGEQQVTRIRVGDGKLCWQWRYEKRREASGQTFTWRLIVGPVGLSRRLQNGLACGVRY